MGFNSAFKGLNHNVSFYLRLPEVFNFIFKMLLHYSSADFTSMEG